MNSRVQGLNDWWAQLPPFNSWKDHAGTLQANKVLEQQDQLLGARIGCNAQMPQDPATSCSLVQDVDRPAGVLPLHWRGRDPPAAVRDALRRRASRPPARPCCLGPDGRGSHQEGQPNLHGQPDPLPRWSQSEHVLPLSCPWCLGLSFYLRAAAARSMQAVPASITRLLAQAACSSMQARQRLSPPHHARLGTVQAGWSSRSTSQRTRRASLCSLWAMRASWWLPQTHSEALAALIR